STGPGATSPRTEGPTRTPATISPTTAGTPTRSATSATALAATRMTSRSTSDGEAAMASPGSADEDPPTRLPGTPEGIVPCPTSFPAPSSREGFTHDRRHGRTDPRPPRLGGGGRRVPPARPGVVGLRRLRLPRRDRRAPRRGAGRPAQGRTGRDPGRRGVGGDH